MKTSKTAILNYILKHFNYTSPSTNDVYHIYVDEIGQMYHTMHSFEFRGHNKTHAITISLMNEYAPYTKKTLKAIVDFESEKLNTELYRYNQS